MHRDVNAFKLVMLMLIRLWWWKVKTGQDRGRLDTCCVGQIGYSLQPRVQLPM